MSRWLAPLAVRIRWAWKVLKGEALMGSETMFFPAEGVEPVIRAPTETVEHGEDDIVERLRLSARERPVGNWRNLYLEAADEIERLRAEPSGDVGEEWLGEVLRDYRDYCLSADARGLDFTVAPHRWVQMILARLRRSAPREVGWHPIETAPRDGTAVLLTGHGRMCIGYHGGAHGWITVPGSWTVRPTHWMPLPDPPVGPPTGDKPPTPTAGTEGT